MKITQDMVAQTKRLKSDCGKTNQEIAEETFMSVSNVQRYINGDVKDADPDAYRRLIASIGGNPDEFFQPSPDQSQADRDLYRKLISQHNAELARMQTIYEASIAYKNRWIRVLAVVIFVLVAFNMTMLLIDVLNPDAGWIRKILGLSFSIKGRLI